MSLCNVMMILFIYQGAIQELRVSGNPLEAGDQCGEGLEVGIHLYSLAATIVTYH